MGRRVLVLEYTIGGEVEMGRIVRFAELIGSTKIVEDEAEVGERGV
jgi:hypothetical protein